MHVYKDPADLVISDATAALLERTIALLPNEPGFAKWTLARDATQDSRWFSAHNSNDFYMQPIKPGVPGNTAETDEAVINNYGIYKQYVGFIESLIKPLIVDRSLTYYESDAFCSSRQLEKFVYFDFDTWAQKVQNRVCSFTNQGRDSVLSYRVGEKTLYLTIGGNFTDQTMAYAEHMACANLYLASRYMHDCYVPKLLELHHKRKAALAPQASASEVKFIEDLGHEAILKIPVPTLTDEQIGKMLDDVRPGSYEDLSGIGSGLQIEAARTLSAISHCLVQRGAKPSETIGATDMILELFKSINAEPLIKPVSRGLLTRLFDSVVGVRFNPKDSGPLREALDLCNDLPGKAAADQATYGLDLKVLEHGLTIAAAYCDIFSRLGSAVKEREGTLSVGADLNIFVHQPITVLEQKLQSLNLAKASMMTQGMNFDSMAAAISSTRIEMGNVALKASAMHMLATQALRTYHLYQVYRMKELGRAVDDSVLEGIGLSRQDKALIDAVGAPDVAREEMQKYLQAMADTCLQLKSGLQTRARTLEQFAAELTTSSGEQAQDVSPGSPAPVPRSGLGQAPAPVQ